MKKRIGDYLVENQMLTPSDVDEVIEHSKKTGLRFGDAAMALGFLTRQDFVKVFGPGYEMDLFTLEPEYFPSSTQALFPLPVLLESGALPLGFKKTSGFFGDKKRLNMGLLDPSDTQIRKKLEKTAKELMGSEYGGIKYFLVMADEFVDVLKRVYKIESHKEELKSTHPHQRIRYYWDHL